MKAVVCDRCDLILPFDGKYHKVYIDFDPLKIVNNEYHLCDGCMDSMREWLEHKEE